MVALKASLVKAALGEEDADLLLRGVKLVDVATGEVYIDGHVHVESSHMTVAGFAEAVLPRGTTAAVFDPHEVANVAGLEGVLCLIDESARLPFRAFFMAPSCVPSAPGLETSGAELGVDEVARLLRRRRVLGLAEVMDYPGVLRCDARVMSKVERALRMGRLVDGHCPGLKGRALDAYMALGARSDHEALDAEEALYKLRRGLWVMIREGSASRMVDKVIPEAVRRGVDLRRAMIVSDDVDPRYLVHGHLDRALRKAIRLGLSPIEAYRLVTLNPSTYFRLDLEVGLIAPGWRADMVLLRSLEDVEVDRVMVGGRFVASGGSMLRPIPPTSR
ncbi:hypothetical protein B6U99_07700 [Candidatus Geothermarchaeota archaeon ex4572_27]|nr:MAG: hypothetical protein B6U99_07700 [Candidatus Geothermarchaeota archaeon ex4572_27]